jgi:transcriptional regulator with XRE-family HTH domain
MDEKRSLPFGKRIRQLRLDNDLSQRDLASKVEIDFTYLSKIENNRAAPPSDAVIRRLATVLNADAEELFALAAKVSQGELRDAVAEDSRIGVLFRKLQSGDLTEKQIQEMLRVMKEGDAEDH